MHVDIMTIVVICIIAGLCYWVNEKLNAVPVVKTVVQVIIVVVAVLLILQSLNLVSSNITISR